MNKRIYFSLLSTMLGGLGVTAQAQNTPVAQMEKLTRGVVAVPANTGGELVSWRFFGTDDDTRTAFAVLRNGVNVSGTISNATCYVDQAGTSSAQYQVVTLLDGEPVDTTVAVAPWANQYTTLKLDRPAAGVDYTYSPNDCSAADVDGDGEYELIVKWDPSNSKDNSQPGITGNVYLDTYKFDGTKLWRIDLGCNIRAGAHYTQFLVFDFDGDGKAELVCKTAPGSIDGMGKYVTAAATDTRITSEDNTKDYRNSRGYILSGPEYLTVFNGQTGSAEHTIFYRPNRAFGSSGSASYSGDWGDTYGNRGDRFLATVAYLDGPDARPSAVMCRGYYTRAYLWAVNFDGKVLSTKWLHGSVDNNTVTSWDANGKLTMKTYSTNTSGKGSRHTAFGDGNHNLSCADVDGDGKDEIIYSSAAIDDDGSLLYCVGLGHGDAMHLSDLDPDHPGLEVFTVHEDGTEPYGWDIHDAATGKILLHASGDTDNGRGLSADIDVSNRGFEFWSSNDRQIRSAQTGNVVKSTGVSVNFRMYWDGDLQDELFDGGKIDKWNGNGTSRLYSPYEVNYSSTCNSTKSTPNLSCDLFGDWREEVILWNTQDPSMLTIFATNIPTKFRVPTLMHDHVYRMGITWQNAAYNQPPHLGYYLPGRFATKFQPQTNVGLEQTVNLGDSIAPLVLKLQNCNVYSSKVDSTYLPDGSSLNTLDTQFKLTKNYAESIFTFSGKPTAVGDYTIVVKGVNNVADGTNSYEYVKIHVVDATNGIAYIDNNQKSSEEIYNLAGVRQPSNLDSLPMGTYIVKRGDATTKVVKL
ncbi:MAG: rhamnogalacturonan lyase [Bacteroidota bacterium]|nr:rhamnogalacturonan lyase [Bacteroidota bacterium]